MDGASMNRYEQQLYTVFKTFDVDNEEALDKSAVHDLCDALQLEDRGSALTNTLFERSTDRVTFAQFRNGLLAVLGGDIPTAPAAPAATDAHDDGDDDSSGREVAPKFIFGSKKYGRRSRPTRTSFAADEPSSPRSSSASRLDSDNRKARQRVRCRRSASAMETREENACEERAERAPTTDTFEHDRLIDRAEALALCRDLSMDRIDHQLVERIFEDSGTTDTTVGEFFDRLNASLTTSMEEVAREVDEVGSPRAASGAPGGDGPGAAVPADIVLEAWENAGVRRPRRLLAELGFAAPTVRQSELERALEDELRALPEPVDEQRDARSLLLLATLALNRLRLERWRRRAHGAAAERDKLRADLGEANRRAGLLAQEVDESHARLENELRTTLRRAEARHADAVRQASVEAGAERERAAAERGRLEAELSRRAEAEARMRTEASAARARADDLEGRALAAEQRFADAERECARLAAELRAVQARGQVEESIAGAAGELAARLHELRHDNQLLRDRNDELCAALEARAPPLASVAPRGGYLSAELHSILIHNRSEECDSSAVSMEQKAPGCGELVARLREVIEDLDTVQSLETECRSCASITEVIRAARERIGELSDVIISPLQPPRSSVHSAAQTEAADYTGAIDYASRTELAAEVELRHEEEKRKLTELVRDLESSLEQMKAEYDKCEEYWGGKLAEEREAFAEEQRLGDERLADLVAKIGEYERQFGASSMLPTIDERHSLEAQFTDLEEEFARYRADKEAQLTACSADASRLAERVRTLEAAELTRRRARGTHADVSGAEVRELRARTARAEAAVRRLHARLAAADLLVKDLYVENCQLAHRRPL